MAFSEDVATKTFETYIIMYQMKVMMGMYIDGVGIDQ